MRRLSILISVFALAAVNVTFIPVGVAAQGTPAAGTGRAVPAEDCQVEPRSSDEVFSLLGLAEGAQEAAPAARTPVPAPPWTAADKKTAAAAEATAREWLACINADDNLRIAALMTDAAITRFFAGLQARGAIEEARANLAATPVPREDQARAQLIDVTDVARLDDGRIVALADIKEPALRPSGQETLLLIFTPVGDRLLIDDVIQFSVVPRAAGTPGAATPQP
jgi:hypothetical protein